jgi:hypothetical protein
MFAGGRRKVNDGHETAGTFRVGMPKFVASGSLFITFGSGVPNASHRNGICLDDMAVAIVDGTTKDRSVLGEAMRGDFPNRMDPAVSGR